MTACRRLLAIALACVLGSTLLAACTDNSPGGENTGPSDSFELAEPGKSVSDEAIPELNVGMFGTVSTLDPTLRSDVGPYVQPLAMESLLRVDSEGRLGPWLATEWKQESDTVYVYTLREGVTFWDGSELTSEDVKYSWEYLARPESRRANFFASVESIDTPDEYTVRVTLKQPDASWQYTPAMYYSLIFQKDFAEEKGETFGQPGSLVMGTGPWRVDSLNPTGGMEMSAYDDYWGGKPSVDRLSITFYSDDNSMALALRAGEIDITPLVNGPKGFDAAAGGDTVFTAPTCGTALLSLPTQTAPWDDVHVRRAVAHAINRDDIVAATQGRAAGPLDTLISPLLLGSLGTEDEVAAALDSVPTPAHDLEAAQDEMARSSVPDGFTASISAYPGSTPVVEVIAAQLEEIGIDLEIEAVNDTTWFADISGPPAERPLTFSETGACAPDPSWNDIWLGKQNLAAGALNIANYAPPEVDQLLADGLTTQDPKQRLQVYTQLLDRLATDVPYVPLYAEGTTYASTEYDIVDYGSYWFSSPWVSEACEAFRRKESGT